MSVMLPRQLGQGKKLIFALACHTALLSLANLDLYEIVASRKAPLAMLGTVGLGSILRYNSPNLAMLTTDAGVPHITNVATSRSGLSTNLTASPATWNSLSKAPRG